MLQFGTKTKTAGSVRRSGNVGRITLDHVWILTILALIWLFMSITPLPPNDLWWHMAAGRIMADEGRLITTNRWAFTLPANAPYVYQSWLSELYLYWAWRLGDVPFLTLSRTLSIVLAYGLAAWHALRSTRNGPVVTLALLLAVMVGWNNWTLRPQTLALVPGMAFVVLLREYLAGRISARWLIALPLLMLIWVNTHGSFAIGMGLVALAWIGTAITAFALASRQQQPERRAVAWRQLRMLTMTGAACTAAMLVNPLGLGIVGYVRGMTSNAALQRWFVEWQPSRNSLSQDFTGFWFYLMVFVIAALLIYTPRRPAPTDVLWFAGLAWLTIGGVRYGMWFALIMLPLLSELVTSYLKPRQATSLNRGFGIVYGSLLLVMVVAVLPWSQPSRLLGESADRLFASAGPYRYLLGSTTPVAATEWLEQNDIPGHFWADMSYTSYTIWQLPAKQVFADLRVELFPESIWKEYFAISSGTQEGMEAIDRWHITHLMLNVDGQKQLHQRLLNTPGWCEPFHDDRVAIMARC